MAIFAAEDFAASGDIAGSTLNDGVATWARDTYFTGIAGKHVTGRGFNDSSSNATALYASTTPPSADYEVQTDVVVLTMETSPVGLMGRWQNNGQMYYAFANPSGGTIALYRHQTGAATVELQLGPTYAWTAAVGTYPLALRMVGNQISVKLGGSTIIGPVTNSDFTAAGRVGFIFGSNAAVTRTTGGTHIDNWAADSIVADPGGSAGDGTARIRVGIGYGTFNWA